MVKVAPLLNRFGFNPKSIGFSALLAIGLRVSLVLVVLSVAGFFVFQNMLENRVINKLEFAAKSRSFEESELFRTIAHAHESSLRMLRLRLAQNHKTTIAFDDLFQDNGENIYRSVDKLYDGTFLTDTLFVDGTAAIIPDADTVTEEEKDLLINALQVATQVGNSYFPELQSYYFFTPDGKLIIRAPNRPDNLLFYRKNSPPDFTIANLRLVKVTSPSINPEREFRCTSLQPIAFDPSGRSWTTGCHTPLDIDGKHVGAFGTSIRLDKLLSTSVISPIEGGESMIISANGKLVVHPRLTKVGAENEQNLDIPTSPNQDVIAIYDDIKRHAGEDVWVSYIDAIDSYVAYGFIEGLDGYFVISYPHTLIAAEAGDAAFTILYVGFAALLLALFTIARTLRRTVIEPLDLLTLRTKQLALGKFDLKKATSTTKSGAEINTLAASTEMMAGELSQIVQNLEETVEERTCDLAMARDEAERASAAKTDFLTNMSHEIRTPLTGVIGMLELLEHEGLSASATAHVQMAQKSSRLLLSLVNDILDISRLEAGKIKVRLTNVDVKAAIQDTVDSLTLLAQQKNLDITVIDETGAPLWLQTDLKLIRQILINLIGNAIKFTTIGGVTVTLNSEPTDVDEVRLGITVTDTGSGLTEEQSKVLFNRFERTDHVENIEKPGAGLGLSIVKELVELLGGSISCQSGPNRGTSFAVNLPTKRGNQPESRSKQITQPEHPVPLDGVRLLAVDDNAVNRIIIEQLCQRLGATINMFECGEDVVEHLSHQKHTQKYDALLLDINMPGISGIETLAQIRALPNCAAELPAIALTADAIAGTEDRLKDAGMNGYVSKPIDPGVLAKAILDAAGRLEAAE